LYPLKGGQRGTMAERIQDTAGEFKWWRPQWGSVVAAAGPRFEDVLKWERGAVPREYRLRVDGEEYIEALRLHAEVSARRRTATGLRKLILDLEPLRKWCTRHGLPNTDLATLREVALPARDMPDRDTAVDAYRQRVYVRDAGRWTTYVRDWVWDWHPDPDVVEDNSWSPPLLRDGSVTYDYPDGESSVQPLAKQLWMAGHQDMHACPPPGSAAWHELYAEDAHALVRTLDAFAAAVHTAEEGDASLLNRFLAGCSYTMRARNEPYARSKWLPEWSVSSLWNGLALQAMHGITASELATCTVCPNRYIRRRSDARYCQRKCKERGKKRAQRARQRQHTAKDSVRRSPAIRDLPDGKTAAPTDR